jgi:hypothetical protein
MSRAKIAYSQLIKQQLLIVNRYRNPRIQHWGFVTLTTWHPLSAKLGTNFADKRRSFGRYSSLADYERNTKKMEWRKVGLIAGAADSVSRFPCVIFA